MNSSSSDEWIDAEEAGCRLLLWATDKPPAELEPPQGLAGVVVAREVSDKTAWRQWAEEYGVASLVDDDWHAAERLKFDGALISQTSDNALSDVPKDRQLLIGATIGFDRHAAMLAGELGADFVVTGTLDRPADDKLIEFVTWWSTVTVLPIAAAVQFDDKGVPALVAAGASFIMLDVAAIEMLADANLSHHFC